MRCPTSIEDEAGRRAALAEYGLSADVGLPSLDPIVEIAVRMFGVPAAAVNMIGSDHVFFAASSGIGDTDMRRDISFCAHAITQDDVMVVEDAQLDPRFHDNPLVVNGKIRFYAGVPLKSPSGHALGALCVIDDQPHVAFDARDRTCLPAPSTVARIGGDEFAILLIDNADPLGVAEVAQQVIAAIAEPIEVDGHEVRIAGSCGLAIAPSHGDTVEELMSSADLALFQAKTGGRGHFFLFIPALRAEAVARRMYDAELHRAVERDELTLFYQPQIRLSDGALTGAEALIRWRHPVRGLLCPAAFLPALEGGTLAPTVGRWVIMTACAQAAIWRRHHPDFRMSVNLSASQFRAGGVPAVVSQALITHALSPEALKLEITENIVLDQEELVLPQLRQVRDMGVDLSFDDFGTGYASLNLLKSYPITHIKIDKSFTQSVESSPHDRAIVSSLLDLTRQIGIKVIAEGVETEEQARFLRRHGCDEGQGFLFGRPVPAELFAEQFWPSQQPVARRA